MGNSAGSAKKKVYIIVGTAFLWATLLLIWLLKSGTSSETFASISKHAWTVMAAVVVFMAVYWTWFWTRARKAKLPGSLIALRLSSDVLLLALMGGVLIWNWPSTALTIIGSALVLCYGARSMNSAMRLFRRQ
jgi:hypothetical protein